MFSNKKEYMQSELSDIFRVKVVAKNILLGSLGKLFLQFDVFFWRNIQIFRIKLLYVSVTLVKQYTSLFYVKQKSFCLVNWVGPFVGPWGPISCSKVAQVFHAYEG